MEKFVNCFFELLDDTDKSLVMPDTVFKELEEWTSILALSLIAMVDEVYDVTLDTDDIRNANTLEELYCAIQQKI
ncbi:phosphopantetheine-binding protein [Bacteroides stercorirosoris]|jgi:acyl carrier protein|uniref:Acyl carrier protein n=1 Tax=Bacteroides stercorirosoris TaxID=871324 RepID=A0A413GKQ9_9BACE|nr:phosphopantetheine-binding protein [Bacteroides stercorirosoris]RGX71642.1 acyl carrier protein [Bacteroides stercorirosoris]